MITLKTAVIWLSGGVLFFVIAAGPLVWLFIHTDPFNHEEYGDTLFILAYGWLILWICIALASPVMGKIS